MVLLCTDITFYNDFEYWYGYKKSSAFQDDEDEELAEPNIHYTETFWTHYLRNSKEKHMSKSLDNGIPTIQFQVKLTSSCASEPPTAMVKLWVCEGPTMPNSGPFFPSDCERSYYKNTPKYENGYYAFNVPASSESIENYFALNGLENLCDAINWWFCDVPEVYSAAKDVYSEFKKTILRDGGTIKQILKLRHIPKTILSLGSIDIMCGSDKTWFGLLSVPDFLQDFFSGVPNLCGDIFANSYHDYVFVQAIVTPTGYNEHIYSTGTYVNVIQNQGIYPIPMVIDVAFVEETSYTPNPPSPSSPTTATLKIGCYNKLAQASISAITSQSNTQYTGTCSPTLPSDTEQGTCTIVIDSTSVPGTCGMEMVYILLSTVDTDGNKSETQISVPYDYGNQDIQYCKMRAGTATCPGVCVDADSDGYFRCCCEAVYDPVCSPDYLY